jgi:tRNA(fMet)-specific endonuclease VapC
MLDTSAYSVFMRGDPGMKKVLGEAEEVYVGPVVVAEVLAGALDSKKEKEIRDSLDGFLASPRVRVLPMNEATAQCYAVIKHSLESAGTPIPANDIWIAASAMQHGLKVVTCDAHFRRVPQITCDCRSPSH